MSELTQEQIRERLLKLLLEFSGFCDQHGLVYYLSAGTLLGAVRHRGFIPWDDDVDLCMPRRDYERFISLQQESRTFNMQCPEMGNADYPFIKILDINAEVKQENISSLQSSFLWLDVFPIDGWPDGIHASEKLQRRLKLLHDFLIYAHTEVGTGTTKVKAILKTPIIIFARLIGAQKISERMNNICKKYNFEESNWVGGLVWSAGYGMKERLPKECFLPSGKRMEFENHLFPVQSGWHEYLSSLYGDYMKLPPIEKRMTHKMTVWVKE